MGKKMMMKLPSIFRNRDTLIHWPSCTHPNTLSFRLGDDIMFKTVNSVFFDNLETPDSLFTSSSQSRSFSSESDSTAAAHESVETIIRGVVRSDRLFFNPGHTSSILEPNTKAKDDVQVEAEEEKLPFKESVALAMESEDPYVDFKKSMEEMVESHGLKDWECLEELLGWYLKMNGKMNHGYIVGAFVDLLVGLGSSPSSTSTTASHESTSFSSAASSFASPPPSSSYKYGRTRNALGINTNGMEIPRCMSILTYRSTFQSISNLDSLGLSSNSNFTELGCNNIKFGNQRKDENLEISSKPYRCRNY